jgi:death-on-curing protein
MKKINKEHILLLHQILIKYTGGADGVRDEGLLESAINTPFATFGGVALCNTIQSKAAKLCFGLVKNHPFVDGNKRIGILAMMSFLEENGIELECGDGELITLGLKLADGTIGEDAVLDFIINHS